MHTREIRGYKNPIIPILNLTKHNDTFFILEGIQHTQSIVNWFPMIIQVQLTDHNFCGDHTWLENVWSINLVDVLSIHNLDLTINPKHLNMTIALCVFKNISITF